MKALRTLSGWLEAWFLWISVTGVSWLMSLVIALVLAQGVSLVLPMEVSLAMGGVVGGALVGLAQWLFLRPEVKGIGSWTLATAMGWTTGLVVTTLAVMMTDLVLGGVIGGVLGGLVLGFAQWLVLCPKAKERGRWTVVTAVGWTAALALGITFGSRGTGMLTGEIVRMAMSGAVGLGIIGPVAIVALVVLFSTPRKKDTTAYVRWLPGHR
jgi:hypothetical protein